MTSCNANEVIKFTIAPLTDVPHHPQPLLVVGTTSTDKYGDPVLHQQMLELHKCSHDALAHRESEKDGAQEGRRGDGREGERRGGEGREERGGGEGR